MIQNEVVRGNQIFQLVSSGSRQVYFLSTSYGSTPGFYTQQANGTETSPTGTHSGDTIGGFGATGYSSGSIGFSAESQGAIFVTATEDWTDSSHGARVEIWATANGSTLVQKVLTISHGNINIVGLPASSAGLSSGDLWCDTGSGNVIKMV